MTSSFPYPASAQCDAPCQSAAGGVVPAAGGGLCVAIDVSSVRSGTPDIQLTSPLNYCQTDGRPTASATFCRQIYALGTRSYNRQECFLFSAKHTGINSYEIQRNVVSCFWFLIAIYIKLAPKVIHVHKTYIDANFCKIFYTNCSYTYNYLELFH